jgi:hypothetical protein
MAKTLIPFVLIAALVALSLFSHTHNSGAQSIRESADGHGTLLVMNDGNAVRRLFSFSARRLRARSVRGQATLPNPTFTVDNGQRYQLQIDIQCMRVVGNVAIFSGTTRRTNDPNLIDTVYFSVQDNSEPGMNRDRISKVFFSDAPDAATAPQLCSGNQLVNLPMTTIESGNIQVRGLTSTP